MENPKPRVPDLELLRKIGSGAYGEVWLARTVTGGHRAVKVIRFGGEGDAKPYERELEALRRYEERIPNGSPGLVRLHHVGCDEQQGLLYYAMELADNAASAPNSGRDQDGTYCFDPDSYVARTLKRDLDQRGHLPARECVELGLELVKALEFLHAQELIHRDVKPANVIIVDGKPKLADVGLVSAIGEGTSIVGTAGYIAPEGRNTPQGDIYSLGKVLAVAALVKQPEDYPALPDHSEGPLSEDEKELNEVLLRACDESLRTRYRTATEMRKALELLAEGGSLRRQSAIRQWITGGLVAVLLVVSAVIWLAGKLGSGPDQNPQTELFADSFNAPLPDPARWQWDHDEKPPRPGRGKTEYQVSCGNGSILLSARAEHEGGFYVLQAVWLDSKLDLRPAGETEVELEFDARATNATVGVRLTAGTESLLAEPTSDVQLWGRNGSPLQPVDLTGTRIRLQLSGGSGLALVRWDEGNEPRWSLADASKLREWRLRLFATAVSAAKMAQEKDTAWLRVHEASASNVLRAPWIGGWVRNEISGLPVTSLRIRNISSGEEAVTDSEGAFVIEATKGPNAIGLVDDDYTLPEQRVEAVVSTGSARLDLVVAKQRREHGDVVRVVATLPSQSGGGIATADGRVYFPTADGSRRLLSLAPESGTVSEYGSLPDTIGFTWAEGKLLAVGTHRQAFLFESADGQSWERRFKLPTPWPAGLAWDGTTLWFVEFRNLYGTQCQVWGVNRQTGDVRYRFGVADMGVGGVAVKPGRLWLHSGSGLVYEVNPVQASSGGRMEDGLLRTFKGSYQGLSYSDGRLLALGVDGRTVYELYLEKLSEGTPFSPVSSPEHEGEARLDPPATHGVESTDPGE